MDSYLRFIEILKSKRNMLAGEHGSLHVWIMLMVDAQVLSLHSKVMKLGRLKLPHLAMKVHSIMAASAFHGMTSLPTLEMSITYTEFNSLATRADDQMSCICRVHASLSVLY